MAASSRSVSRAARPTARAPRLCRLQDASPNFDSIRGLNRLTSTGQGDRGPRPRARRGASGRSARRSCRIRPRWGPQPGAEDHAPAAQVVKGRHLTRELLRPSRDRSDHGAQLDPRRSQRGGGKEHPRIAKAALIALVVDHVVPHEQRVHPAASAADATLATVSGSAKSPKLGMLRRTESRRERHHVAPWASRSSSFS